MKIKATLEFNENTLEEPWHTYDVFDDSQKLVGKLYLRENHFPPENLELYKEVKDNE